jgi:hypothetical protein
MRVTMHFMLALAIAASASLLACAGPLCAQQPPAQPPAQEGAKDEHDEIGDVSPDGRFSVEISHKVHPQGDEAIDFFTLELKHASRTVASYPTSGFLLKVYWSPGNEFVAINNRRANSGDYLWILSLKDGSVLKRPDDRFDEDLLAIVQDAIRKRDRRATTENFRKYWLVAKGWRSAGILDIGLRAVYEDGLGVYDYDTQVRVGERLELSPAIPVLRSERED